MSLAEATSRQGGTGINPHNAPKARLLPDAQAVRHGRGLPTRTLTSARTGKDGRGGDSAVTKYTAEITDPGTVPEAMANAFRAASAEPRGAVALLLADDIMPAPTQAATTSAVSAGRLGPAPASGMAKAAALIRSTARPVLMVGVRGTDVDACASVHRLLSGTGWRSWRRSRPPGVVSGELESCYVGRVGLFKNQRGDIIAAYANAMSAAFTAFGPGRLRYGCGTGNACVRRVVRGGSRWRPQVRQDRECGRS